MKNKDYTSYIIDLPKIMDERGNLSFLENFGKIPFKIKRCYWIYDVPGGQIRGGHAFKKQKEIIIALSGSFSVVTNTGKMDKEFYLNRSYYGLFVPQGVWRHLENFSTNSVALIITDTEYDEQDYIREFDSFTNYLTND